MTPNLLVHWISLLLVSCRNWTTVRAWPQGLLLSQPGTRENARRLQAPHCPPWQLPPSARGHDWCQYVIPWFFMFAVRDGFVKATFEALSATSCLISSQLGASCQGSGSMSHLPPQVVSSGSGGVHERLTSPKQMASFDGVGLNIAYSLSWMSPKWSYLFICVHCCCFFQHGMRSKTV